MRGSYTSLERQKEPVSGNKSWKMKTRGGEISGKK